VLPVLAVWANVHGSVLLGIAVCVAVLGLRAWGSARRRAWRPAAADAAPALDVAPYVRPVADGRHALHLMVEGVHCGGCVRRIERALAADPAVVTARVNLTTRRLAITWQGGQEIARRLMAVLSGLGFRAVPYDPEQLRSGEEAAERQLLRAMAVAGFAAGNVMLLSVSLWAGDFQGMGAATRALLHWFSALIALPAVVYAGRPFFASAWQALRHARRPRIHVFLATSDIHLHYKLRITREQCIAQAFEAVRYAATLCPDIEFSPEDASRTDLEFLCSVTEAVVEAGATTVNIPDTVGYTIPTEMSRIIGAVCKRVEGKNAVISVHCHNDLGMAVANSLAGVMGGARQIECTINGIGERAGNAALEEIVMTLRIRADHMPFTTSVQTKQIYPSSEMLTKLTGQGVQVNKAVVGRNAFAHEAGIHQDGMLKDRRTYEIMRAEDVGAPWNPLVLGKHSGRHAVQRRCADLGFTVEGTELIEVYRTLMAIADDRKVLTDQDIRAAIAALGSEHPTTAAAHHDAIDPFDTPSAAAHHAIHESGYGHGV